MSFKPFNWSVIILGRWNTAILTPAGIIKSVFGIKEENKNVQVEVPLDGVSPFRVKHPEHNIIVMVDDKRLCNGSP